MGTAVYIGAGTLLEPLQFIDAKKIICVDGQPFSEFGKEASWANAPPFKFCPFIPCWYHQNQFSRPEFISELKSAAKSCGLKLVKKEIDKYTFENKRTKQTIIYYINTAMPDDTDKIVDDIQEFEHLIVMGFHPHSDIMNYTTLPVTFWGNIITAFCKDPFYDQFAEEDGEDQSIIYRLNYEDEFENKFNQFNLLRLKGEKIEFNSWFEFLNFKYDKIA